jgi:hypothetical protein
MEKIVEIRVKKIPIRKYIEDYTEFTFRTPRTTNAKIYMHHFEEILTEKPDIENAIPLVSWVYEDNDSYYQSTLYLINGGVIREVIIYDKIFPEEEIKNKRRRCFYLQYRETVYYRVELP